MRVQLTGNGRAMARARRAFLGGRGGAVIVLYGVLLRLARDGDGTCGAVVLDALAFGGLWILIGILRWAAAGRGEGRREVTGIQQTGSQHPRRRQDGLREAACSRAPRR
jgi:hypothetical protein